MLRRLLIAAALSVALLNLACEGANHATREGNERSANASETPKREGEREVYSDGWITTKAKLALIADRRTSGFATDVDTRDALVTLSGKVDTSEAKMAADEVIKSIEGVKSVNNQLQVVPEAKRKEVNATDDKIEDAIEAAIEKDAALSGLSLTSDSNAGVVTVSGSVDSHDQLLKYAQVVRNIPGVKSVVTTPVEVKGQKRT